MVQASTVIPETREVGEGFIVRLQRAHLAVRIYLQKDRKGPQEKDATPHPAGKGPQEKDATPHPAGKGPQEKDATPHSAGKGPQEKDATPHPAGKGPQEEDATPHSAGKGPQEKDATPHPAGKGPQEKDATPHPAGKGPQEKDATPHPAGKGPQEKDATPPPAGKGPQEKDATPHSAGKGPQEEGAGSGVNGPPGALTEDAFRSILKDELKPIKDNVAFIVSRLTRREKRRDVSTTQPGQQFPHTPGYTPHNSFLALLQNKSGTETWSQTQVQSRSELSPPSSSYVASGLQTVYGAFDSHRGRWRNHPSFRHPSFRHQPFHHHHPVHHHHPSGRHYPFRPHHSICGCKWPHHDDWDTSPRGKKCGTNKTIHRVV
ncbi:uncharacterized protein LOC144927840 [Branchiostoma floridae x Branchiostoma belcheri]